MRSISDNLRQKARRIFWKKYTGDMFCIYCNAPVSRYMVDGDPLKATIDHVIPLKYNGKSEYNNLVLSCLECNRGRENVDVYGSFDKSSRS